MDELLNKYARYLQIERNNAPLTVRNYTTDIRDFLDFLEAQKISPARVDRSVLRRYLGRLNDRGIARPSISRKISTLRSFYRYLERENMVSSQPLAAMSAPKKEKRLPSFLTQEEAARFLGTLGGASPQAIRDKAIFEMLYAAGLRVSEIVSLNTGDIDMSSRQLRVWGKGSKQRMALMGRPATAALRFYLDRARGKLLGDIKSNALFVNRNGGRISQRHLQRLIIRYSRIAGINERVHPHIMRHSFATHLLDGGADLRSVQELLGHARLSSTQIYTHVTLNQLQRSYLAAHPRSGNEEKK